MCAEKNHRTVELGKNLHRRYVSVNTGLCTFLPEVKLLKFFFGIFFANLRIIFYSGCEK